MADRPAQQPTRRVIGSDRPFVGREDLIGIFTDTLTERFGQTRPKDFQHQPTVLVFHGLAGIGKSELCRQLRQALVLTYRNAISTLISFDGDRVPTRSEALYQLRASLKKDYKLRFPAFDLAYTIYKQQAQPDQVLNKDSLPFLSESGIMADIVALVHDIPVVGLIPRAGEIIVKRSPQLRDWWHNRGQQELTALRTKTIGQIEHELARFLAGDIRRHMKQTSLPVVVFLDTYEALMHKERESITRSTQDQWVRDLVQWLPETLWVLAGREEIEWEERESCWEGCVEQHRVEQLSPERATAYLTDCGIDNGPIREKILVGSGCVPLYLSLSVDTFFDIRDKQQRVPVPDEFGGTKPKIIETFVTNKRDEETDTLKVLSCANRWDRPLFELLVSEFDTGLKKARHDDFHRMPCFTHEPDNTWVMHDMIRRHLQHDLQKLLPDTFRDVHQYLFDHYDKQLADMTVKNITEQHRRAIPEAYYHAEQVLETDAFCGWICNRIRLLYDAAQWSLAETLYVRAIPVLEGRLGKEDSRIATCLNNLALLYESQGKYTEAEPLYHRAIEIGEKTLGPDHPDLATRLNNLALLYKSQGKYTEAEPLYRRAIEIDKKALGSDHPGLATDLNNLAGLYRAQGKYTDAEPLYVRCVEIFRNVSGFIHPNLPVVLRNLADLYDDMKQPDKAVACRREADEAEAKLEAQNKQKPDNPAPPATDPDPNSPDPSE